MHDANGITLYLDPRLEPKHGYDAIRIKLRGVLFFSWLELEGAKAIPEYEKDG